MSFAAPHLLWLALLAPAVALAAGWLWRRRLAAVAAWASRGLWDRLLAGHHPRRLAASVALLALAVLCLALALARPRWGLGEQEVERRGVDLVIVLDSSLSMAARDVPPSRLFAAKTLIRRLMQAAPENRVALVQAEGAGEVLSPLTLDGRVIDLLLDTVEAGSLATPGTDLAAALEVGLGLYLDGETRHRVMVLLSDGEDHGAGTEAISAKLAQAGVVTHALGIGTLQGAPLPLPGDVAGELKRDEEGRVVISRLGEPTLRHLAESTGATYQRITSPAAGISSLIEHIEGMEDASFGTRIVETSGERFQWPLAAAGLCLLLHLGLGTGRFRRNPNRRGIPGDAVLAITALLATGAAAPPVEPALGRWSHNPRELTATAVDAYRAQRPDEAAAAAAAARSLAPDDPRTRFNAGTTELAAGRLAEARESLQAAIEALPAAGRSGDELAPVAHYNLGNTLLAGGDAAAAVTAYEEALRRTPDLEDAKINLELALRELEQQSSRPSPSDEEGGRDGEQDPPPDRGAPPEDESRGGETPQPRGEEEGPPQTGEEKPKYEDQPDMSAQEAAAILEAVANLERQQRREESAARARRTVRGGKDW